MEIWVPRYDLLSNKVYFVLTWPVFAGPVIIGTCFQTFGCYISLKVNLCHRSCKYADNMKIIWKSNVENTQTYWSSQSAIHADMEAGTTHNCGVHSHGIFSECVKFLQASGCNILNSIIWPGDFNSEAQFVHSETWLKNLYEMCILQYLAW